MDESKLILPRTAYVTADRRLQLEVIMDRNKDHQKAHECLKSHRLDHVLINLYNDCITYIENIEHLDDKVKSLGLNATAQDKINSLIIERNCLKEKLQEVSISDTDQPIASLVDTIKYLGVSIYELNKSKSKT